MTNDIPGWDFAAPEPALKNTPAPLFLIGNKRSGTSHLVRLLNLHPEVFVTHEADIIWILCQWVQRLAFVCYPWDGPLGMEATLEACSHIFHADGSSGSEEASVAELFYRVQRHLIASGSRIQTPRSGNAELRWLGDKKPVQQADPEMQPFVRAHFPAARYLHIVRDPRSVVGSMVAAGQTWARVAYWKTSAPEQLLERWAIHEEWVLAIEAGGEIPVFSLRFEDLCAAPIERMAEVLAFLDLGMPPSLASIFASQTQQDLNRKYASFPLAISARARRIMDRYGYR